VTDEITAWLDELPVGSRTMRALRWVFSFPPAF
jgi:hypothetical protein